MIIKWYIRIMAAALLLMAIATGAVALLIGTDTGTRWLVNRAPGYVPGELAIAGTSGSLLGGVGFDSVEWRDDTTEVSARNVTVNVDLLPLISRRVEIKELAIGNLVVSLTDDESGVAEEDSGEVDLPVVLTLEAAAIDSFLLRLDDDEYRVENAVFAAELEGSRLELSRLRADTQGLEVSLAGNVRLVTDTPVELQADWRQTDPESAGFAGVLGLSGDASQYNLQHELTAPFSLDTEGFVRLDPGGPTIDLMNRWAEITWPVGEQQLQTSGGSLGLRGTMAELLIDLDTVGRLDDLPVTAITLVGSSDLETLRMDRLTIVNDWGRALISGTAARLPEPAADIEFDVSELDAARLMDALTGQVAARGNAALRLAEDGLYASVSAASMTGTVNDRALEGSTVIDYSPTTLGIRDASLRLGDNTLRVVGTVAESVDLQASADLNSIDEILPDASGSASVTVSLSGPVATPNAQIDIAGQELKYGSTAVESLTVSASGTVAAHEIDAVALAYGSRLDVRLAGGLDGETWQGRLQALELDGDAIGRWTSREAADFTGSASAVSLSRLCIQGTADATIACAAATWQSTGSSNFDLTIEGLPLAALPVELPPDILLAGTLEASASGSFADERLNADALLQAIDASLSAEYEGEKVAIVFEDATGQAKVVDNRLESTLSIRLGDEVGQASASLTMNDVLQPETPLGGVARVSVTDISPFAVFVPSITNPSGAVEGALQLAGTLREPQFVGDLRLNDGAFSVRPAGIDIRELQARVQQVAPGVLLLSGSALSGEGRVSIDGNSSFSQERGIRSAVFINGENFELLRLPDWRLAASPNIAIVFDERTALVTGKLAIPSADITVQAVPETAITPSPDATVHIAGSTQQPVGRQIDIDITTSLGESVKFTGFGLTTGLAGNVQIKGGTQRPYLGFGQVDLIGGRYKAYGQELTIDRGELIFNGPLENPNLDVRATRTVDDVLAGIHLTGTPAQLRSTLYSEPPLGDAETLAYLLTGRPLSSATTAAEGNALNNAAFALGMSKAGNIASQIGSSLGLETLSVEGGTESGRIVAGKRIGGRLLVEYGYGLVDNLGTLLLRYQINNRLSLESRTGTVSNLDIVYSVRKR